MRDFTQGLVSLGVLAGLIFGFENAGYLWGQSTRSVPNIVLLYADDMGWGDLACQNPDTKIPTPHLDQLAKSGTRFTDAHSSSGVCTPSRYALLTGQYHWRKFHGIVNSFEPSVLDRERTTLAELLRGQGYRTACVGKWHLGWNWQAIQRAPGAKPDAKQGFDATDFDWSQPIPDGPVDHGFDFYFGDDVPNFPPYAWFENNRLLTQPTVRMQTTQSTAEGSFETRPGPGTKDWDFNAVMPRLTDRAVSWLEEQSSEKPFFLYFPFTSPHAPIVPEESYRGRSSAGGYGDYVMQTDAAVGRILAALQQQGLAENTLVIFTSDNGPETYAYPRLRDHGHSSMGPLRGLKRDLWEGGHRVPTVVCWPGKVPAGRVADGLLSQIDLYATLATIVNAPIPPGNAEDSYDLSQFWLGLEPSVRRELVHNTNAKGYALRQDEWVLIDAPTGAVSQEPDWIRQIRGYRSHDLACELYQLSVDLEQKQNLAAEQPERVTAMRERLSLLTKSGQVR